MQRGRKGRVSCRIDGTRAVRQSPREPSEKGLQGHGGSLRRGGFSRRQCSMHAFMLQPHFTSHAHTSTGMLYSTTGLERKERAGRGRTRKAVPAMFSGGLCSCDVRLLTTRTPARAPSWHVCSPCYSCAQNTRLRQQAALLLVTVWVSTEMRTRRARSQGAPCLHNHHNHHNRHRQAGCEMHAFSVHVENSPSQAARGRRSRRASLDRTVPKRLYAMHCSRQVS